MKTQVVDSSTKFCAANYERDARAQQAAADDLIDLRLSVRISDDDAAYSLVEWLGEQFPRPKANHLGWDLHRLFGDDGYDMFAIAVATFGELPAECWIPKADGGRELQSGPWLSAQWESFARERRPGDLLIIDLVDKAIAYKWDAPADLVAAVKSLRNAVEKRRAEREAAEEAEFQVLLDKLAQMTPLERARFELEEAEAAYADTTQRYKANRRRKTRVARRAAIERLRLKRWRHKLEESLVNSKGQADMSKPQPKLVVNNNVVPPLPPPPGASPAPQAAQSLPLKYFAECRESKLIRQHIKGLMAEGATSSVYGEPKTLKSTMVIDIGVHLASGRDWRGHRIKEPRGVVYFAFERSRQVEKALAAYAVRDGIKELPFAVVGRLVDMINPGCVDVIVATIRAAEERFGIPVGLAIFDTWSKAIAAGGGNEDKAEHQNAAAANLRRIIEHLPEIHCMTIGHTGKDKTKGERGSNATKGDRDVGILVEGTDRTRKAKIEYANDLPDVELTAFEGEQIMIGEDEEGEPATAFILSQRAVTVVATKTKLSGRLELALLALDKAIREHGDMPAEGSDLPPVRMVTVERWKEELFRSGVLRRDAANPRTDFRRIRNDLVKAGAMIERDGFVWPMQPGGVNPPGQFPVPPPPPAP